MVALALLASLLGCAPPSCTATCKKVVDECGFGEDIDLCIDHCKLLEVGSGNTRPRHEFRDCLAKADCGDILLGRCAISPKTGADCPGYYLALAEECLDEPRAFRIGEDCWVRTDDADWGVIGEPWVEMIGYEGAFTVRFGQCDDSTIHFESDGSVECEGCEVTVWQLF